MQWHIDTIPWQEIGSDGTKYALLDGARDGSTASLVMRLQFRRGFGTRRIGTPKQPMCL